MAKSTATRTPVSPWIKSDEIFVDTSKAPWMDIAKQELGKNIRELGADDAFIRAMRAELAMAALERSTAEAVKRFGSGSTLLGTTPKPFETGRFRLNVPPIPDTANQLVGRLEADRLRERNPEITKYFQGVTTDPSFDRKGRSFAIAPTYEAGGRGEITAWCAAFVNWCLTRAGAPALGYATARSWLDFGTPVAHPVYGCLTIVKPSSATGSTTGHVAFFVGMQGDHVRLLGGNQGDKVTESSFRSGNVLGYRWPTVINHYLAAGTGVLV